MGGKLGMVVVGVITEDLRGSDMGSRSLCRLPLDIRMLCETIDDGGSDDEGAGDDDECTVVAYKRNCRFARLSSDQPLKVRSAQCQDWVESWQGLLEMRLRFDVERRGSCTVVVEEGTAGRPPSVQSLLAKK